MESKKSLEIVIWYNMVVFYPDEKVNYCKLMLSSRRIVMYIYESSISIWVCRTAPFNHQKTILYNRTRTNILQLKLLWAIRHFRGKKGINKTSYCYQGKYHTLLFMPRYFFPKYIIRLPKITGADTLNGYMDRFFRFRDFAGWLFVFRESLEDKGCSWNEQTA